MKMAKNICVHLLNLRITRVKIRKNSGKSGEAVRARQEQIQRMDYLFALLGISIAVSYALVVAVLLPRT